MRNLALIVLAVMVLSCQDKIKKYGYEIDLQDVQNIKVNPDFNQSRQLSLKILNDPYGLSDKYKIIIRFDSVVVYKGTYNNQGLNKIKVPTNLLNKFVGYNAIIYKEDQNQKGFYFEPKIQFFMHEKDNFIIVHFSESAEYSDRLFISSQEILG